MGIPQHISTINFTQVGGWLVEINDDIDSTTLTWSITKDLFFN
jgi:hypothetical protein